MSKLMTETQVRIDNVRASYEHLIKPSAFPGAEPKYSVCALVSKDDKESLEILKKAIANAEKKGVEKFGQKYAKAQRRNPLMDGDVEKEGQPGYENHIYFNASNKIKPRVLDATTGLEAEESDIYSGMYGKLIVNFYPYYSTAASCGVTASLRGFQKTDDGDVLGGARVTDADFSDEAGGFLD